MHNTCQTLSSQAIRNALLAKNHVQPQEMGDAIEAFEDIANLLHECSSSHLNADPNSHLNAEIHNPFTHKDCEEQCIAHSVFLMISPNIIVVWDCANHHIDMSK